MSTIMNTITITAITTERPARPAWRRSRSRRPRAQLEPKLVVEAVGLGAQDERGWFARVVRYAYVEMLDDLALSLVVGVLLSGAIVAALPPDVFQSGITHGFPALILMLLVGIPFYVCALTSTPIAAALIAQGLSPGAAFVFLLAGPATNAASLVMLSKVLGRRVVIVQLVTLSIAAVALGWLIDRIYPWLGGAPPAHVGEHVEHAPASSRSRPRPSWARCSQPRWSAACTRGPSSRLCAKRPELSDETAGASLFSPPRKSRDSRYPTRTPS
jgi:hypothetical protein